MQKAIVITSISKPTEAVKKFSILKDYDVIVVGDKKSPSEKEYSIENVTYLPVTQKLGYDLENILPYNHYCRKMLGYLYSIKNNYDVIIDTDDDNLPYENFGFQTFDDLYNVISSKSKFINIYNFYTDKKIWARGLPLKYINILSDIKIKKQKVNVGVWQGLADEDPDVDAIYRLTDNSPCYFNKNIQPYILSAGVYSPFNSQNTAFRKEIFPLMYLPATVTFRYTDILRGLVAQPIMNLYGFYLGFHTATVIQKRNQHDYMKDFESEIPVYLTSEKVVDIVNEAINKDTSLKDNIYNAYKALSKNKIVKDKELSILECWLEDC